HDGPPDRRRRCSSANRRDQQARADLPRKGPEGSHAQAQAERESSSRSAKERAETHVVAAVAAAQAPDAETGHQTGSAEGGEEEQTKPDAAHAAHVVLFRRDRQIPDGRSERDLRIPTRHRTRALSAFEMAQRLLYRSRAESSCDGGEDNFSNRGG